MKFFTFLIGLLTCINVAQAQYVDILQKVSKEGSSTFFTALFYDEANQPVVPERVTYFIDTAAGVVLQEAKVMNDEAGGSSDTSYFSPNNDTASSMTLVAFPCGTRIINEANSKERNYIKVWFLYPNTCDPNAIGGSNVCKSGQGVAGYDNINASGLYVRKGAACSATPTATSAVTGCLVADNSLGSACDGTE